ncbi:MAG: hypothetical protein RL018_1258 [Pseudomonadota bacterium]|jgi:hypothetical protein
MKYMTRQEYYEHLCKIGMPDLIAASMAAQSTDAARTNVTKHIRSEIFAFGLWAKTIEGSEFWNLFIDECK